MHPGLVPVSGRTGISLGGPAGSLMALGRQLGLREMLQIVRELILLVELSARCRTARRFWVSFSEWVMLIAQMGTIR